MSAQSIDPDETMSLAIPSSRPSRRSSSAEPSRGTPPKISSAQQLNSDQAKGDTPSIVVSPDRLNSPQQGAHRSSDDHIPLGPLLRGVELGVMAQSLGDIEALRMAVENRLGVLTRTGADKDGVERGFGLTAESAAVVALTSQLQQLTAIEKGAILALKREFRKSPLYPWFSAQIGLGPKQGPRLLAAIRDPYWHEVHERPRTEAELRQYCGHGEPSRKAKGQRVFWSPEAKMRLHLMAESCIKQARSPYRLVYDEARAKYADATHGAPCIPCGTKGAPAPVGSELRDGHKHANGLRMVGKAILRDLWAEARRLHEEAGR